MLAQCPVCAKADKAGRFMSTRPNRRSIPTIITAATRTPVAIYVIERGFTLAICVHHSSPPQTASCRLRQRTTAGSAHIRSSHIHRRGPNALLGRLSPIPGLVHLRQIFALRSQGPHRPWHQNKEVDQSFEPSARNRRPTAVGAALKMSEPSARLPDGSDEQMFGAKEQVPHRGMGD